MSDVRHAVLSKPRVFGGTIERMVRRFLADTGYRVRQVRNDGILISGADGTWTLERIAAQCKRWGVTVREIVEVK